MNRIDILREQCDKLNELLAADPAGMNDLMSCGAIVNKAFADDSDVPVNQDAYGRDVASVMGLICGLTRTDEDHTIIAKMQRVWCHHLIRGWHRGQRWRNLRSELHFHLTGSTLRGHNKEEGIGAGVGSDGWGEGRGDVTRPFFKRAFQCGSIDSQNSTVESKPTCGGWSQWLRELWESLRRH